MMCSDALANIACLGDVSQKERRFQDEIDEAPGPSGDGAADETEQKGKYPWSGVDRDYSYEELLG